MAKKQKATEKASTSRPATPPAKGFVRVVRTVSSQEGLWRAGVKHSKSATDFPVGDFSDAQIDQLIDEPKLTVEFVDLPDPAAKKVTGDTE